MNTTQIIHYENLNTIISTYYAVLPRLEEVSYIYIQTSWCVTFLGDRPVGGWMLGGGVGFCWR